MPHGNFVLPMPLKTPLLLDHNRPKRGGDFIGFCRDLQAHSDRSLVAHRYELELTGFEKRISSALVRPWPLGLRNLK
jgi:hypothetical protein